MNTILRIAVEKMPSFRWKKSEIIAKIVYQKTFKEFGNGSVIVSPLKLKGLKSVSIGQGVSIYDGVWLQAEAQGQLTIGSGTYIGHHSHIHAVSDLTIGSNCVIADNVLINNSEHIKGNIQQISTRGPINIGNRVFIGQNVVILANVTVGDDAIIGAGSVVTKNVPAGATVVGVPARIISQ